jgi:protein required for attachment to host cells
MAKGHIAVVQSQPMTPSTQHLPDAMPEITKRTLLVVCDNHHCKLIDVANHTLLVADGLASKEPSYSDKEGSYQSPGAAGKGGVMGGLADPNPVEKHRLKEFANTLSAQIDSHIRDHKIEQVYISAPGKFLSELDGHLSNPTKKLVVKSLDGNYVKEAPRDVLQRFMPELASELQKLRDQENYSPKNQLPKNGK